MKSIKTKLFLFFGSCMAIFILLGLLMNSIFLEKYYIYKNRNLFDDIRTEISTTFAEHPSQINDSIGTLDRVNGVSITMTDSSRVVKYHSYGSRQQNGVQKLPKAIEDLIRNESDVLKQGVIYTSLEEDGDQGPKLVYITKITNNHILVMMKPLKGIRESTAISNQFYMITGIFAVIVGGLLMYAFSSKFTKPIVTMSAIAENIANLDFEQKVTYRSQDEIGVLAYSINKISAKLKVSIERLKDDIEFQKTLARNVSHELKTPIGVIKGYAEGLLFGVADTKEMSDSYCHVIVDECDRMDHLVRELLDLSLLESRQATLDNVEQLKVSTLVETIIQRFEPIFQEHEITYEIELDDTLTVLGDIQLLERALSNIVLNAVKYNNHRRIIEIKTEKVIDGVKIEVFNTAQPIPEQQLPYIWDVFYKVDQARSRKVGGHGIGLAIVKSIILLHDGEVSVANRADGVQFTFILPNRK